jgi:hypothetical protein
MSLCLLASQAAQSSERTRSHYRGSAEGGSTLSLRLAWGVPYVLRFEAMLYQRFTLIDLMVKRDFYEAKQLQEWSKCMGRRISETFI